MQYSSVPTLIAFAAIALAAALLVPGCGDKSITEASCASCEGPPFTAEDCAAWGKAAGCKSSRSSGSSGSCTTSCSFTDCARVPECSNAAEVTDAGDDPDAGDDADAALDPECENSDDGLFTVNPPPCDDYDTININGVTYYACECGDCPCDFVCGSIPLSVGGTISSVCAPPE